MTDDDEDIGVSARLNGLLLRQLRRGPPGCGLAFRKCFNLDILLTVSL